VAAQVGRESICRRCAFHRKILASRDKNEGRKRIQSWRTRFLQCDDFTFYTGEDVQKSGGVFRQLKGVLNGATT
jgi:hypothetical protein